MTVRRFLEPSEVKRLRPAIAAALRERAAEWGLQGWSVVGRGRRLRVAVRVPFRRVSPKAQATLILVGGFQLKVAVVPTFSARLVHETASAVQPGVQPFPFAPGSPIIVDDRERCGAGAFLSIDDKPYLVTCGHAFGDDGSRVKTFTSGEEVAALAYDLREAPHYLDAAVCELTEVGVEQASDSRQATTWATRVHVPVPDDNGQSCVLWPTHEDTPDAIELTVFSFSTDFFPFCSAPAGGCSFIEAQYIAPEGDSGGPLTFGGAYYGLCRGTNSHSTFFTPVTSVVNALRTNGKVVRTWSPS